MVFNTGRKTNVIDHLSKRNRKIVRYWETAKKDLPSSPSLLWLKKYSSSRNHHFKQIWELNDKPQMFLFSFLFLIFILLFYKGIFCCSWSVFWGCKWKFLMYMIFKTQLKDWRGDRERSHGFMGWWSGVMPHPEGLCKQRLEVHRGCAETWACAVGYRQVTESGRSQSRLRCGLSLDLCRSHSEHEAAGKGELTTGFVGIRLWQGLWPLFQVKWAVLGICEAEVGWQIQGLKLGPDCRDTAVEVWDPVKKHQTNSWQIGEATEHPSLHRGPDSTSKSFVGCVFTFSVNCDLWWSLPGIAGQEGVCTLRGQGPSVMTACHLCSEAIARTLLASQ